MLKGKDIRASWNYPLFIEYKIDIKNPVHLVPISKRNIHKPSNTMRQAGNNNKEIFQILLLKIQIKKCSRLVKNLFYINERDAR